MDSAAWLFGIGSLEVVALIVIATERVRGTRSVAAAEDEAKARSTGQDWTDPPA